MYNGLPWCGTCQVSECCNEKSVRIDLHGQAVTGLAREMSLDARGDGVGGESGLLQQLGTAAVLKKNIRKTKMDQRRDDALCRETFADRAARAAHHCVFLDSDDELVRLRHAQDEGLVYRLHEAHVHLGGIEHVAFLQRRLHHAAEGEDCNAAG